LEAVSDRASGGQSDMMSVLESELELGTVLGNVLVLALGTMSVSQ
jgi:hypothetical protein